MIEHYKANMNEHADVMLCMRMQMGRRSLHEAIYMSCIIVHRQHRR